MLFTRWRDRRQVKAMLENSFHLSVLRGYLRANGPSPKKKTGTLEVPVHASSQSFTARLRFGFRVERRGT
jgi:hypothetical protein